MLGGGGKWIVSQNLIQIQQIFALGVVPYRRLIKSTQCRWTYCIAGIIKKSCIGTAQG